MNRSTAVFLVITLCSLACSAIAEQESVEIRLRNVSDVLLEDVVVMFPEGAVAYGDLEAGAVTAYETVDRAYRYAAVRAVIAGDSLALTPVDYVGESLLEGGRYTYEIGLSPGRSLTLVLEPDA